MWPLREVCVRAEAVKSSRLAGCIFLEPANSLSEEEPEQLDDAPTDQATRGKGQDPGIQ